MFCLDYWSSLVGGLPTSPSQSQSVLPIATLMISPNSKSPSVISRDCKPVLVKVWIPEHGSLSFASCVHVCFSPLISPATSHAYFIIYLLCVLTFLYILKPAITSSGSLPTPHIPPLNSYTLHAFSVLFFIISTKRFINCNVDLSIFLIRPHEHGGKDHDDLCDACIAAPNPVLGYKSALNMYLLHRSKKLGDASVFRPALCILLKKHLFLKPHCCFTD